MIRERVDFFRFHEAFEDVFVTPDGFLLYANADQDFSNPFVTFCRVYEVTEEEAEAGCLSFADVCGTFSVRSEAQCIDLWSLSEMRPASIEAATEVIAAEYAANESEGNEASFAELKEKASANAAACMSRAFCTYWGHLFPKAA